MITIKTYQDLVKHQQESTDIIGFVRQVINEHKSSVEYQNAIDAQRYYEKRNTTILAYQKLLYRISGEAVPDNYSANYKLCSGFYNVFTTQEIQYLLGNGVTLGEISSKERLGKTFDSNVQNWATKARIQSVAFGFWNLDHIDVFALDEFAPLYDEEDGSLKAGVRFWQIAADKPLRATLYELDGYTDMMWSKKKSSGEIIHEKRAYKISVTSTKADGDIIYKGENYPTFPIVPMYGNESHTSSICGLKEQIDCFDLIKSGFANDVDDCSQIYWILQGAGGMDDIDLAKFVKRMHTVKAAVVEEDGARAESHTQDVPYASREALLTRLENDLYRDAMALDVKSIASGAATATQIRAAYEPLSEKGDKIEYQITKALEAILALAGIEDTISFTRSTIINRSEEISVILQAAEYLPEKYITEKILTVMGDVDRLDEILKEKEDEEANMNFGEEEGEETEEVEEMDTSEIDSDMIDEYGTEVESMLNELLEELNE